MQLVERNHLRYLGVTNLLRLARPEFVDRLVKALATRLRTIYDAALSDVERWNKAAAAQLDAQVRERRRSFTRRVEAIERIQEAAGSLEERIQEIEMQTIEIKALKARLEQLTSPLLDNPSPAELVLPEKRMLVSD